ncbi:Sulfatase-modifying factor enzyme 1 [Rhodobacter capsulatus]|uniref:Sulfatase-modifying factor enzyme 1 n=2 Tax=Rhodobacter capsulatus TaxID=1061 RepID=A0A1G7CSC9_RHOCA|nr:Sulfatase-modifying factor enzyme 1 [Rhodobacter capsulatus]
MRTGPMRTGWMTMIATAAALATMSGAVFAQTAAAPAITWEEKYYNPQPAEGDLTLPMPCGGAMVFRRIDTPNTEGAIGDVAVVLGQEGEAQPYLDGLRRGYVSGPFSDAGGAAGSSAGSSARGYFWMAKYELAEAQYTAVTAPECPDKAPRKRDFLPAVGHSKIDYDLFAQSYTLWLLHTAPQMLPAVGATRAFLRLPTEEEWEFAERGGTALSEAQFRAPLPPLAEGESLSEYVAYGGTESAGGKIQIIGTLKPNALGLHDMLGNAAEIIGAPFYMVRHGRMHGQAGGYVKRGGDARTPAESLGQAIRYEVAPYDLISGTVASDRFTGTRLVISALSINAPDQQAALIGALDDLARPDPGLKGTATETEARQLLEQLAAAAADGREKSRIERIRAVIDAAQAERNAQRDRTLRMVISASVMVCDQAVQRLLNAFAISMLLPDYDSMEMTAMAAHDTALAAEVRAEREAALQKLRELKALTEGEVNEYSDLVEGLGADYSAALLEAQLQYLRPEILARSARRGSCLALLETHLDARRTKGFADMSLITKDFTAMAKAAADLK